MKAGRILSLMYTATVGQETRNVRVDRCWTAFPNIRCPDESDGSSRQVAIRRAAVQKFLVVTQRALRVS